MVEHSKIVEDLGGGTKLAEEMKMTATPADRETIYAWKARGSIPARYWPALIEVARRLGKNLSAEDFLAGAASDKAAARPQPQSDDAGSAPLAATGT